MKEAFKLKKELLMKYLAVGTKIQNESSAWQVVVVRVAYLWGAKDSWNSFEQQQKIDENGKRKNENNSLIKFFHVFQFLFFS